jgi:hypothetical protein
MYILHAGGFRLISSIAGSSSMFQVLLGGLINQYEGAA